MEGDRDVRGSGLGPVRRLMVVALAAAMGLVVLPATAAHADTWRSATSTGWGPSPSSGQANATANARAALNSLAASFGERCTNVTVSTPRHLYTAPDGSAWIYEATATGYCVTFAPAPATR